MRISKTEKEVLQRRAEVNILYQMYCIFGCETKTIANTAQDGSWDALGHALGTLLGCSWGFWGALGALLVTRQVSDTA